MKINELLKFGYEILKKNNIDSFVLDSELILGLVLNKKREWILSNPEFILHRNAEKRFFKLISKRTKHYPVAYMLGYKYFCGLKFKVNKNVLIPRPETETLVNEIMNSKTYNIKILDVGTGCGNIAISLAKKLHNTQIIASDISKYALNMAKKNSKLNNVYDKIKFVKSDLLKNIEDKNIDVIVTNLPYVKTDWKHPSIKYEPKIALYSYKDGLSHYKKLLYQIKELGFNPKYIYLEIDPSQVEFLTNFSKQLFRKPVIEIKKDLNGLDRIFIIKLVF